MTHDPEVYTDPDVFRPERFIAENGETLPPDPRTLVFGFGRRCVFLSILWSTKITLEKDLSG